MFVSSVSFPNPNHQSVSLGCFLNVIMLSVCHVSAIGVIVLQPLKWKPVIMSIQLEPALFAANYRILSFQVVFGMLQRKKNRKLLITTRQTASNFTYLPLCM